MPGHRSPGHHHLSTLLVQVIWAHPRPDSLTATIASDVIEQLRTAGVEVDELDLYREGIDPVLRAETSRHGVTSTRNTAPKYTLMLIVRAELTQ